MQTLNDAPTLGPIRKLAGIAGQFGFTVQVTYSGEAPSPVTFTSSVYGPPIVMITAGNPGGVFVTNPDRFGPTLTEQWVRAFFGAI